MFFAEQFEPEIEGLLKQRLGLNILSLQIEARGEVVIAQCDRVMFLAEQLAVEIQGPFVIGCASAYFPCPSKFAPKLV